MTQAEEMAAFVERASYSDLSGEASRQIKIRVLDALGCSLGALGAERIRMLKSQIEDFNSFLSTQNTPCPTSCKR